MTKQVDKKTKIEGEGDLYSVLSIAEAAALWGVSPATVRYHIDRGNIVARKCGHTVIVPSVCMVALYGLPQRLPKHTTSSARE